MDKDIDRIAFEFWCGVGNINDLEHWAEQELKKETPHPDAGELFGLDRNQAERESLRLAKDIMNFEPISESGEQLAKTLLHQSCNSLLQERITPFQLCTLVRFFESKFLGMRTSDNERLDYPEWLGDLWNCCDWCDESWNNSNSPHLLEEAKKILSDKKQKGEK